MLWHLARNGDSQRSPHILAHHVIRCETQLTDLRSNLVDANLACRGSTPPPLRITSHYTESQPAGEQTVEHRRPRFLPIRQHPTVLAERGLRRGMTLRPGDCLEAMAGPARE